MKFESWIISNTNAGGSSATKYSGAISGRLSRMAIEHNLSTVDLLETPAPKSVAIKLKSLDEFKELNSTGNSMYSRALDLFIQFTESNTPAIEDDISAIIHDVIISPTEKENLVNSRIGQGQFREKLIKMWGCCSVTGCKEQALLVASHIKPWSQSTNEERLYRYNGLLLISTLDKAFDAGLISFDHSGKILIAPCFSEHSIAGVEKTMRVLLHKEHEPYMQYHRQHVYRET